MSPPFPSAPSAVAPPASLLRRFDRLATQNLALPPIGDFAPTFGAFELRQILARRGAADGPQCRLPLHLLVRLPCGDFPEGGAMALSLARELLALVDALGAPPLIARVTLQACGRRSGQALLVGEFLGLLASRFDLPAREICVMATRADRPSLQAWRRSGVTRVVLDEVDTADRDMAGVLEFASLTARVDCGGERDEDAFGETLQAVVGAGVPRVQLRDHACLVEALPSSCESQMDSIALRSRRGVSRARAIEVLQREGYRHVAVGLFVHHDDPLLVAKDHGKLQLEVDGLANWAAAGTLAIGAGVFGRVGTCYYRNAGGPSAYVEAVAERGLSASTGVVLSREALARHAVVNSLVCHGWTDFESIALGHLVEPKQCFGRALRELAPLARAGLVDLDSESIELTAMGEHLVDAVAAVFNHGAY